MPYEVTITRSDIDERQHWIANSPRVLATLLATAYRDGWWLVGHGREGATMTFEFIDTRGETMREEVRFLPDWRMTLLHGPGRR